MKLSRRDLLMAGAASIVTGDARAWFPHGVFVATPNPPSLLLASATGIPPLGNLTNNSSVSVDIIFGQLPITGDIVVLKDGASVIGTKTLTDSDTAANAFSFPLAAFSDGVHSLTASFSSGGKTSAFGPALSITVDTVPPTLSAATGAQNGSNDYNSDLGITTNEGNGVVFWVVTASASQPTKDQILAGQNNGGTAALANGFITISSTGAKTATAFGVTTGTRYAHFIQEDLAGNFSAVVSTSSWSQTNSTGFGILATIAPDLWIDLSDRLTLFQDIAGTIPVDLFGAGEVIGKIADKSGNGFDLTSTADTIILRPLFNLSSYRSVQFDGIAQFLRRASALGLGVSHTSGVGSTICMAVKGNPGLNKYLLSEASSTAASSFFDSFASNPSTAADWMVVTRNNVGGGTTGNQTIGPGVFDNTWRVLTFIDDGVKFIARSNGVQIGTPFTYSTPVGSFTNNDWLSLGARAYGGPSSNSYFASQVAVIVAKLSGSLSGANVSKMETLIGAEVGLTI